ncbi:MAG: DCC1-like thiol-disulfide oxidoreductase family protein [Spirochaetota bacterium]
MIILFDGVCNLCNGVVNHIIDHDPKEEFQFASLQSLQGQELLKRFSLPTKDFDSIILVDGNTYYKKSTAALRIAQKLDSPLRFLYPSIYLPEFLRDFVYSLVARSRYKFWGKADECRIPTPELQKRFL